MAPSFRRSSGLPLKKVNPGGGDVEQIRGGIQANGQFLRAERCRQGASQASQQPHSSRCSPPGSPHQ